MAELLIGCPLFNGHVELVQMEQICKHTSIIVKKCDFGESKRSHFLLEFFFCCGLWRSRSVVERSATERSDTTTKKESLKIRKL